MPALPTNAKLTFGLYEVDLASGEIWKAGFRIKLQSQPFRVLAALLERPGQLVTRDELQLLLWGKDTVVDFDHSLGTAINKIREALGDSAENPRFVETLARRGYRFIAPVAAAPGSPAPGSPAPGSPTPLGDPVLPAKLPAASVAPGPQPLPDAPLPDAQPEPTASTVKPAASPVLRPAVAVHSAWPWIAAVCLLGAAALAVALVRVSRAPVAPPHIVKLTRNGHLAPSINNWENLASNATDGVHLFAPVIENGRATIAAISLASGMSVPLNIPGEIASPALGGISPDGSLLLVREHLSPESEQPLWVVPTLGGSAQRVGSALAHEATWMPDGTGILFATGDDLYLTHLTGNDPQLYATLPGRAFWMRWSPNGKLLRFSIIDPLAHTLSLWQLTPADRKAVRILPGFTQPSSECCGVWTADGSSFVFQSSHGGNADLWKLAGDSTDGPVRVTDGPLQFEAPVAAKTGDRVYFLGVDARSELQKLTPAGLVPEKGFFAGAVRLEYSRDRQWLAWTDETGHLWRARNDGTAQTQLTPDTLDVFLAHWSPDGSRLALMAREPGKAWGLYTLAANGTDLHPLLRESRNAADPSWSADGNSLVFGRVNDMMGKEMAARTLELLDLKTGAVSALPGSEGLFSPRWSPDGRYIAALSLDQRKVQLLDVHSGVWKTLPVPSGADPVWSSDSKFLYLHASLDPAQPIDRISIPDGHVQDLVRLADSVGNDAVDYVFVGLTSDNAPLVRSRVFTGNLYSTAIR